MPNCEYCTRPGNLVAQFANNAQPSLGIQKPWVFRYYLCKWHLAVWNRRLTMGQTALRRVELKTDAEVLKTLQ